MELSRAEQWSIRERIFSHQDGISVASVVASFREQGVLDHILDARSLDVDEAIRFVGGGNPGYINVAFRLLACQGWFDRDHRAQKISLNAKSLPFVEHSHLYTAAHSIIEPDADYSAFLLDGRGVDPERITWLCRRLLDPKQALSS